MNGFLTTDRLMLRPWRPEDRVPFAALNADPKVCEFLSDPLTPSQSDAYYDRIQDHWRKHGFGRWAVEIANEVPFIGFVGFAYPNFEADFRDVPEIGWRLAAPYWANGYAAEGARAVLSHGFDVLGFDEVVSFTVVAHKRSRAVMERIGMTHNPKDDFSHPFFSRRHPLCRHVLYRKRRDDD